LKDREKAQRRKGCKKALPSVEAILNIAELLSKEKEAIPIENWFFPNF
jgi:hypothetical protein